MTKNRSAKATIYSCLKILSAIIGNKTIAVIAVDDSNANSLFVLFCTDNLALSMRE